MYIELQCLEQNLSKQENSERVHKKLCNHTNTAVSVETVVFSHFTGNHLKQKFPEFP